MSELTAKADPTAKLPDNEPGRYYVDKQCIDCDVCRDVAPKNFTRNPDNAYSFVYKQPANTKEEDLCHEALISCPVDVIGDDGEV